MANIGPDDHQPERAADAPDERPQEKPLDAARQGYVPTVHRRAVLSGLAQERITSAPARSGVNRLTGGPKPQPNRRPLLIAGIALALVVALGLGVFAYSSLNNSAANRTPTGALSFYIDKDIPWARVTLDGATLNAAPVEAGAPLVIAPGKHQIRWEAEPFQPQGCVFSVPAATGDTCPIETAETAGLRDAPNTRLLLLRASLASLAPAQQRALTQALAAASGYTAALQAGESYPTGPSSEAVTAQPASVALKVNLALNAKGANDIGCQTTLRALVVGKCALAGRNCMQLCSAPWQMRQATQASPRWLAFAVGRLGWSVSGADGKTLAPDQPVGFGAATTAGHLVAYSITWESQTWRATPVVGAELYTALNGDPDNDIAADPACAAAYEAILGPGEQGEQKLRLQFVSGASPAAGCLVTISALDNQGTPLPGQSGVRYLYRVQQILAANDIAHQLNPHVPVVSGAQKAVTDQLSGARGQIITVG